MLPHFMLTIYTCGILKARLLRFRVALHSLDALIFADVERHFKSQICTI